MKMKIINQYGQEDTMEYPKDISKLKSKIMHVKNKSGGLDNAGIITRVYFSKTGKTIYFKEKILQSLKGRGFKSNFVDIQTGEHYWVSGPKKNGSDRLYGGNKGVVVDPDVFEEYKALLNKG